MNSHSNESLRLSSKPRKVRKGTHSCWECKRRKVRCIFAQPTDAICTPCSRRGKECISQDLPDRLTKEQEHPVLTRTEAASDQLFDRAGAGNDHVPSEWTREASHDGTTTFVLSAVPLTAESENSSDTTPRNRETTTQQSPCPMNKSGSTALPVPTHSRVSKTAQYSNISQALRQAFPPESDIVILLGKASRVSTLIYQSNFRSRSALRQRKSREETQLPNLLNPETHPVLLARQMLYFAAALLYLPSNEEIDGLTEHHRIIMERLAESAIDLVTTNDVLLGTIESLECIIVEGCYHVDAGNMRRAWIVFRRAIVAAQIMGLHRSDHYHILKVIDAQNDLDPQTVWVFIVLKDRMLSLLLGLPSSNTTLSTIPCPSMGRSISEDELPRLQSHMLARILERNELGISQHATDMTRDIDQQLVQIADSLPPKFWQAVNFTGLNSDSKEAFWETRRAWDHMCHYTLLNQLHLPYVLSMDNGQANEYSKIACTNASREILTRLIAFRTFNPLIAACRMGDFLALIAGMTLMLVHIVSHCNKETGNVLVHQRLGDRATVEEALKCMESISKLNEDILTMRCATLLEHLLRVEADAVQRQNYRAYGVQQTNEDHEDKWNVLLLAVPYVGTIELSPEGIRSCKDANLSSSHEQNLYETISVGGLGFTCIRGSKRPHDPIANVLQESATRSDVDSTSTLTSGQPYSTISEVPAMPQSPLTLSGDFFMGQYDLYPDVAAGMDDWVFQGIDTAFFDNLLGANDDQVQ